MVKRLTKSSKEHDVPGVLAAAAESSSLSGHGYDGSLQLSPPSQQRAQHAASIPSVAAAAAAVPVGAAAAAAAAAATAAT